MKRTIILAMAAVAALTGGLVTTASAEDAADDKPVVAADKAQEFAEDGPEVGGFDQVEGLTVNVPPQGNGRAFVACPDGRVPSGGGGKTSGFRILFTDSFQEGNGWVIRGTNINPAGGATETIRAVAICTAPR
ncbi:hypothetical protein FGW37_26595 [Streptomyces rectiverticillatus]|uniref:hypothetical protein n=1 Tax=Streptomyces rectiverticillatus TaxID=173860 RepID=UPI0015C2C880|nr:hypothetical protein [Streptomyces rectiverticillatus]QLE74679.1 hypothetical protein FGW37_26595 [Streptomyces rectiverticillatus]